MTTPDQMTVWETIDLLAQQRPFTKEKLEKILGVGLSVPANPGNDFFQFYQHAGIIALQGSALRDIDLRVNRSGGPGFLLVNVDKACISLDDVRRHYPAVQITGVPRGRSPDEATSHSINLDWGKLSFQFTVSNPQCLARIAFDPKAGG